MSDTKLICGDVSPLVPPDEMAVFICCRPLGHSGAHQARYAIEPGARPVTTTWQWFGASSSGVFLDGRDEIDAGGCCPECGAPNDDGDDALCAEHAARDDEEGR